MELALRSTARVAGIFHLFGEVEEVVEVIALFVVADRLDYAPRHGLRASSRIDPAVGPDGERPTGVRVRMTCKWVPLNGIRRFAERPGSRCQRASFSLRPISFSSKRGREACRQHSAANLHKGTAVNFRS